MLLLAALAAAAAGCRSEDEAAPGPESAGPPEPTTIQAVRPANMAREVSRRPTFQWKLPRQLADPALVSFVMNEAGTGDEPVTDKSAQRRVLTATGLDAAGPEGIDPWDPPPGSIVTGEVTESPQLAPETWYRWRVRVLRQGRAGRADFYFRTRAAPAVEVPPEP
jgi:hypothetical protein